MRQPTQTKCWLHAAWDVHLPSDSANCMQALTCVRQIARQCTDSTHAQVPGWRGMPHGVPAHRCQKNVQQLPQLQFMTRCAATAAADRQLSTLLGCDDAGVLEQKARSEHVHHATESPSGSHADHGRGSPTACIIANARRACVRPMQKKDHRLPSQLSSDVQKSATT